MTSRVLIIDFGSQTTQLIARRVREQKVYCEIQPCTTTRAAIEAFAPGAIILSGGPASTHEENAPAPDDVVWSLNVPILGICYGMQMMIQQAGGVVGAAADREFGRAPITVDNSCALFAGMAPEQTVWMSHGDQIAEMPSDFITVAQNESCPHAAVHSPSKRYYGVQFHPEVTHTEHGAALLKNFLFGVANLTADWEMTTIIEHAVEQVKETVGDAQVVMGLSGGVDSSVAAALIHRAIGDRLHCIYVDHGLARKGELEQVREVFGAMFPVDLRVEFAEEHFLAALEGVADPELKRKRIGNTFIEVFEAAAKQIPGARFLGQGTLYPDVIESVSFRGPSATIKSHHNVGGLPEKMHLKLVEPLREMFKDEVRAVGKALGLPDFVTQRQPFPGPGLAIRILGAVDKSRLDRVRDADAIVREEIDGALASGHIPADALWQWFCVLLPVKSVGVMGDARTYEETACVRTVHSVDGMTADFGKVPYDVLGRISTRIINEVRGINRVVYDISSKPPATIEWE